MTPLYPAETNRDGVVTSWIPLTTVYTPSSGGYFMLWHSN
jgi:hypothetical protein